jgi:mannose-6-phosphate isomerase-like protein (cupin superfamily)
MLKYSILPMITGFLLTAAGASAMEQHSASEQIIIKKKEHHIQVASPFCGQLLVVSTPSDNPKVDMAIAIDIKPTQAHFHKNFQEIYVVLDGELTLELYDPKTDKISKVTLQANELVMIPPGVHHGIVEASKHNRLQVLCVPGFDPEDEHKSDKL